MEAASTSSATAGNAPKVADFDELVDEVLAKKGPARYTDGLSEENWENELENIPLFMTKPPDTVDAESAPAVAALQDLIYQEATPHSRAIAHKEDGNEHYKKRRYKQALQCYTEGLKQGCEDNSVIAVLLGNRATSQYYLGNYRSALNDANKARNVNPDYMKAIIRGAECCVQLKRYEEALLWCDDGLRKQENHSKLTELRAIVSKEKKKQDRDKRKELAAQRAKTQQHLELIETIKSRGVQLNREGKDGIELSGPHPAGARVHISSNGSLIWPVMLLYPEYRQTDYIEAFNENDRFVDHLKVMFETPPPWDVDNKYHPQSLMVYYEDQSKFSTCKVDPQQTLASVLQHKSYIVSCGTPSFLILSKLSPFTSHFLKQS